MRTIKLIIVFSLFVFLIGCDYGSDTRKVFMRAAEQLTERYEHRDVPIYVYSFASEENDNKERYRWWIYSEIKESDKKNCYYGFLITKSVDFNGYVEYGAHPHYAYPNKSAPTTYKHYADFQFMITEEDLRDWPNLKEKGKHLKYEEFKELVPLIRKFM